MSAVLVNTLHCCCTASSGWGGVGTHGSYCLRWIARFDNALPSWVRRKVKRGGGGGTWMWAAAAVSVDAAAVLKVLPLC